MGNLCFISIVWELSSATKPKWENLAAVQNFLKASFGKCSAVIYLENL